MEIVTYGLREMASYPVGMSYSVGGFYDSTSGGCGSCGGCR